MKKLLSIGALCSSSLLLAACAPPGELDAEDEETAAAIGALAADNALAPNALAPNALAPNALAPNALAPNALAPNALSPAALTSLQTATETGALARELLRYVVSCALSPAQSFPLSWSDTNGQVVHEVYWGLLGIAPGWATGPLADETQQRLVSGCLAARVNWYGLSVLVSIRSHEAPLNGGLGTGELLAFRNIEGVFWGNLFAPTPYMNACHHPGKETLVRAAFRDCAVGHLDGLQLQSCGLIALRGPCSDWCADMHFFGQHYPSCTDHPGVPGSPSTGAVVTTALP